MLENIGAGIFFIIWLPLTIGIFMKLKEGKTIVSFDGVNGYLSAYLGIFVWAGFIAAVILLIPLFLLKSVFMFLINHWEITLAVIVGIGYLLYSGNSNENAQSEGSDVQSVSSDNPLSEEPTNTLSLSETHKRDSPLSDTIVARNDTKTPVKYCGHCGAPMASEDLFCGNCGKTSN